MRICWPDGIMFHATDILPYTAVHCTSLVPLPMQRAKQVAEHKRNPQIASRSNMHKWSLTAASVVAAHESNPKHYSSALLLYAPSRVTGSQGLTRKHVNDDDDDRMSKSATVHWQLTDLVCKLFNEDQGANEDVGILHVFAEDSKVAGISKLFKQVTHNLDAHIAAVRIDVLDGLCQG